MNSQQMKNYRKLLKIAHSLKNYNFREYFSRKIQHDFRNNHLTKEQQYIDNKIVELQRIVTVQNLYCKPSSSL